jgi:hypothetical protein
MRTGSASFSSGAMGQNELRLYGVLGSSAHGRGRRALASHQGQERFDQQTGVELGAAFRTVADPFAVDLSGMGDVEEP